eukprot:1667150-Alexandrium_andersonii.AAC.1
MRGGNTLRATRPSSATLAAQAAEEAPGGQPSATCANESRMQHRQVLRVDDGRQPARLPAKDL